MTKANSRMALQAVSIGGLILCAVIAVWGWRSGILTSKEAMQTFVDQAGAAGIVLFTAFQAVQVVIPILPGGISCLAGVLLFGTWRGFLCNYIGICIGSMMAFAIAKNCGRPLMEMMFSQKTIAKYDHWTDAGSPFTKWFAIAIFLPVAPDDFLCYLAGTTEMKWRTYTAIIWLCKPFAIAMYSLGLSVIWDKLLVLFQ